MLYMERDGICASFASTLRSECATAYVRALALCNRDNAVLVDAILPAVLNRTWTQLWPLRSWAKS
jgi:hypothetical protein